MLRLVFVSALLSLTLAARSNKLHDISSSSSSSSEESGEKRGHCPALSSNSSLAACPTSCPNGTNCTTSHCSSDTECPGIQKCCNTSCAMQCVQPQYKLSCREDEDCGGTLVCCRGRCVTVCVTPKPPSTPNKPRKGKEVKGKHR